MSGSFDAVLFDFGGVFTDSPFLAAEAVGRELGAPPGRVMEIVFGPYDSDTDHPWHRLERGETDLMSARDAILALGEVEGLETDLFRVLALIGSSSSPRGVVFEHVGRLRASGIKTAIVTNNAAEFRDAWRSLLPSDDLFDAIVDSSEIGVRKPNPEIYHHALAAVGGVAPERAVFLDDYEGNVVAARALGLTAILVEPDFSGALAQLADLTGVA